MMTKILVLGCLGVALFIFLLGLFHVAIPDPVLLGLAFMTVAFIIERLSGYVTHNP